MLMLARLVLMALTWLGAHRADVPIMLVMVSFILEFLADNLLVGSSELCNFANLFCTYLSGIRLLGLLVPRFAATDSAILSA